LTEGGYENIRPNPRAVVEWSTAGRSNEADSAYLENSIPLLLGIFEACSLPTSASMQKLSGYGYNTPCTNALIRVNQTFLFAFTFTFSYSDQFSRKKNASSLFPYFTPFVFLPKSFVSKQGRIVVLTRHELFLNA
jgi:hypothetical protein